MPLLPLDLSLNVALAVALFILGTVIWSRRAHSTRAAIAVLMSFSLAFWLCVEWLVRAQGGVDPVHIIVWQGLYWFTVTLGPALILHLAAHVARRRHRLLHASYGASLLLLVLYVAFSIAQQRQLTTLDPILAFKIYTSLSLGLYALSVIVSAVYLYPLIHAMALPRLERRQAQYALVILSIFALGGVLQFLSVPAGTGILSTLAGLFLLATVAGGSRSALLDVHLTPLDGMFSAVFGAFVVLLMRTQTVPEALVGAASLALLMLFAAAAMHLVHDEAHRRKHLEDVHEQIAAENAQHRDRLALVAHQVRGPVGGIGFVVESVLRGDYGDVPETLHEPLHLIRQSVNNVTPILTTHLESLAPDVALHPPAHEADVVAELDFIARQLEPRARDKGLKLELSCADMPELASLDPALLRHVAFNLIDNAIKYTDQGLVLVRVSRYPHGLFFSVTDSGMGLDEEDQARLFQPFTRLSPENTALAGSGMGLYLVKRLLDEAGGTIEIRSEGRGRGTTFMVEIPFV